MAAASVSDVVPFGEDGHEGVSDGGVVPTAPTDTSAGMPRRESDVRKTFMAESIGVTSAGTRDKFNNILEVTTPAELNEDYTSIYSTCALVGALVMSFLAPSATTKPSPSPDTIWGTDLAFWVCEANHILAAIIFLLSFIMVFLACVMITQLAHVPKSETKFLFERLGDGKVHAPLQHMQKLLSMYAIHFVISTTLVYHWITAVVTVALTLLAVVSASYSAMTTVSIKTKTLQLIRSKFARSGRKGD